MTTDFYKGKHIAVFGLGTSGLSATKFLLQNGADVVVWDNNKNTIKNSGFTPCNLHTVDLTIFDFIVVSPGISNDNPICQKAIKNNVPLIGEVELLWQTNRQATYIGITGTNGKSTTTALIAHILQTAGIKCCVGGNFGTPALALEKLKAGEIYVLEMSSYMLTRVPNMNFNMGIFLNLSEDHLIWHKTMDKYYRAKAKIFNNMKTTDVAIICNDDEYGKKLKQEITVPKQVIVSKNDIAKSHQYLSGEHNKQNIACAIAIAKQLNISDDIINTALDSFTGLVHRQQFVAKIAKTTFINDSKATNAISAQKALSSYKNIYWIAGGEKKSDDYSQLNCCIKNVKKAFLIGIDSDSIAKYLNEKNISYEISNNLDKAIKSAHNQAVSDNSENIVLLSPACASFDQFNSFEQRGENFIKTVRELNNG